MEAPRKGAPRRLDGRRWALWSALSIGWLAPSAGCQVEYAGMTLPSGKYMHDDVQYFPPGPDFPWSNTQAATQRARMAQMGIETGPVAGGPLTAPVPPGVQPGVQERSGRIQNVDSPINSEVPPPPAPAPAGVAPGGAAPAVPPPGGAAPAVPPPAAEMPDK